MSTVGGDDDVDEVVTLGNILRQYDPHVEGLSTCDVRHANLNLAVTGATVQGATASIVFVVVFLSSVKAMS